MTRTQQFKKMGYEVRLKNREAKALWERGTVLIRQPLRSRPAGPARMEIRRVRRNETSIPVRAAFAVWVNRWTGLEDSAPYISGVDGSKRWVREQWWDYRTSRPLSRAPAEQRIAGFQTEGRPPLPAISRRACWMPHWACRMICVMTDLKLVHYLGKYYWEFKLRVIERREVKRDDGR